jgi:enoyl-CoA hydratase
MTVEYSEDGVVSVITLSREKALNALNVETLDGILSSLARAEENTNIRGVILTGAGEKAFAAGADIGEMQALSALEARKLAERGHKVGRFIDGMSKPVIAAVNGFALGGGCEIALACDFILASEKAKFGQPEVNLGVVPGFGGTQRLPRRIPPGRALELLLTGEMIGAEEALRLGLANRVVAPDKLLTEAKAVVSKIAEKGPLAIALARRAARATFSLPLDAGLSLETEYFASLFATSDQKEGMKAFLEKRPPRFQGA